MVGAAGLEPATLCLEGRCSIHLSYAPASFNGSTGISRRQRVVPAESTAPNTCGPISFYLPSTWPTAPAAERWDASWDFERNDSINNVGSQARVDFGGANQPKGSEERSRTCS